MIRVDMLEGNEGCGAPGDPSIIRCCPGAPDQTLMTADRYSRWAIFQFNINIDLSDNTNTDIQLQSILIF